MPVFPLDTLMINANLGFKKVEDTIYYLHQGKPINCHQKADKLNAHVNHASCADDASAEDKNQPRFTLIFDREGYSPELLLVYERNDGLP